MAIWSSIRRIRAFRRKGWEAIVGNTSEQRNQREDHHQRAVDVGDPCGGLGAAAQQTTGLDLDPEDGRPCKPG